MYTSWLEAGVSSKGVSPVGEKAVGKHARGQGEGYRGETGMGEQQQPIPGVGMVTGNEESGKGEMMRGGAFKLVGFCFGGRGGV